MDIKADALSVEKQSSDGTQKTSDLAPFQLAPPAQKAPPAETTPHGPPAPPAQTGWSGKKKALVAGLVVLAALAIGYGVVRYLEQPNADPNRLVLYGNVDLRQVELAFNTASASLR
jgi:hypothetical protein